MDEVVWEEVKEKDLALVASIALASKSHWDYSEDFLGKCKTLFEKEFSPSYLEKAKLFLVYKTGEPVAVVGLLLEGEPHIDHFWILPKWIGKGFGKLLFSNIVAIAKEHGLSYLMVVSDLNAESFYQKMGFVRVGYESSPIQGKKLPVLKYDLV